MLEDCLQYCEIINIMALPLYLTAPPKFKKTFASEGYFYFFLEGVEGGGGGGGVTSTTCVRLRSTGQI